MPVDWFRLPETGTGTESDPYRPAYLDDHGITRFAGNKYGDKTPRWVARVCADDAATLDALAAEAGVTRLSASEAADHYRAMAAITELSVPVEDAFRVSQ